MRFGSGGFHRKDPDPVLQCFIIDKTNTLSDFTAHVKLFCSDLIKTFDLCNPIKAAPFYGFLKNDFILKLKLQLVEFMFY